MTEPTKLFHLNNGKFRYGVTTVLEDLNFSLEKGKFYGLIGPNGSGKSTLINLLMGIRILDSGTLLFSSKPLSQYSRKELALHLSLVPQNITIGFEFNVHDIVMMGRHPHIPRFSRPTSNDIAIVEDALTTLDIYQLRNRAVGQLSGGERQRVIVARALAQQTDVLMLDEATSNLDIEHTLQIMRILKEKVKRSAFTVIAAIHDLNVAAAFCDELVVLSNKKIHSLGTVGTTLTSDLLENVFSVNGEVINNGKYPRILYEMHSSANSISVI